LTPGTEVLVRRWTSPMKISFVRPKPLARRLSAKRCANKTRIRPVLSLGSPGSPLALADGTAITNHQAQRPCERVGTNSKPWRPAMLLQALDKIHESRRGQGHSRPTNWAGRHHRFEKSTIVRSLMRNWRPRPFVMVRFWVLQASESPGARLCRDL